MTEEERARIFVTMSRGRHRIDELRQISGPGLYAIFLEEGAVLPGVEPGSERLLYIGETESLLERLAETHFKKGQTALSPLRRTLGAILKEELGLLSIPPTSATKDKDPSLFRFRPADETRLTRWMARHLRVAAAAGPDLQDEAPRFIARHRPAVNVEGWKNPARDRLEKLLQACRAEARATTKE